MLLATRAVLGKNQSVGIVLLVLDTVVVSALAFGAFERDLVSSGFNCHNEKTPCKKITPLRCLSIFYHNLRGMSIFFELIFSFF